MVGSRLMRMGEEAPVLGELVLLPRMVLRLMVGGMGFNLLFLPLLLSAGFYLSFSEKHEWSLVSCIQAFRLILTITG